MDDDHLFARTLMKKIIWSAEYETGINKIDEQHKSIVRLINQLIDYCATTNSTPETLHNILHTLASYTTEHLDYEEEVLDNAQYPELDDHTAKHEEYLVQISEILFKASSEDGSVSEAALDFLAGWWDKHILIEDMQFRDFLLQKH
jgi:hemerythrin